MDPFALRVIASFVVGGLYIGTIIAISERFGTKIGGILAGLPTTALIALIFIGLTSGNTTAQQAAVVVPAIEAPVFVFVYVFTRLMSKGRQIALSLAIAIWFLFALLFVRLHIHNILLTTCIGLTGLMIFSFVFRNYPKNLKSTIRPPKILHVIRVLAGGTVIATAVIAAHVSGPVWGGVFSTFPATFASTLYMLHKSQGPEFTKALARQLPLSAISIILFAVLFYFIIGSHGLFISVTASMAGSLLYAFALAKSKNWAKP